MADIEKIEITLDNLTKFDKRVEIIDGEIVQMPAPGVGDKDKISRRIYAAGNSNPR